MVGAVGCGATRTDSPLLRPALLYVKSTRSTFIGPPGAEANHCATSCSVALNGMPRSRTYEDVIRPHRP